MFTHLLKICCLVFREGVMPALGVQEAGLDAKSTPDISVWMVDKVTDLSTMLIVFALMNSIIFEVSHNIPERVKRFIQASNKVYKAALVHGCRSARRKKAAVFWNCA